MSPTILTAPAAAVSPLVLSDRLLTLAQSLLALAHSVFDEAPSRV